MPNAEWRMLENGRHVSVTGRSYFCFRDAGQLRTHVSGGLSGSGLIGTRNRVPSRVAYGDLRSSLSSHNVGDQRRQSEDYLLTSPQVSICRDSDEGPARGNVEQLTTVAAPGWETPPPPPWKRGFPDRPRFSAHTPRRDRFPPRRRQSNGHRVKTAPASPVGRGGRTAMPAQCRWRSRGRSEVTAVARAGAASATRP